MSTEVFNPLEYDPTVPLSHTHRQPSVPGSLARHNNNASYGSSTSQSSSSPSSTTSMASTAAVAAAEQHRAARAACLAGYAQRRPDAHLLALAGSSIQGNTMLSAYPRELTTYSIEFPAKELLPAAQTQALMGTGVLGDDKATTAPFRAHDASALNPLAHPYTSIGQVRTRTIPPYIYAVPDLYEYF